MVKITIIAWIAFVVFYILTKLMVYSMSFEELAVAKIREEYPVRLIVFYILMVLAFLASLVFTVITVITW